MLSTSVLHKTSVFSTVYVYAVYTVTACNFEPIPTIESKMTMNLERDIGYYY